MIYKQPGSASLSISCIGFGCMSLKPGERDSEFLIHKAIDNGINFFDTADLYNKGENEFLVGKALKGKRNKVVLATKAGNVWRKDGSGWDWNPSKEHIIRSAEDSLKRLQTDHIDLFQLHGGTLDDPINETLSAFEMLVKQGKIRYYGISSIRPNVIREWVSRSNMISVMTQYSLLDRRPEEETLNLLKENGMGVLARGSLAQGLLINKPAKEYLGFSPEQVHDASNSIEAVSRNRSKTSAAIRFVLSNPSITSAVIGMRNTDHLNAAINSLRDPGLNEHELEYLRNAVPPGLYEEHR